RKNSALLFHHCVTASTCWGRCCAPPFEYIRGLATNAARSIMFERLRAATISAGLVLIIGSNTVTAQSGPRLRIGHYSTGNGLIVFVLDRTGTPIKVRFDGSDEILALSTERSSNDSLTLRRDDGIAVLRIQETGQVVVFSDQLSSGSANARRDQDAEP